MLVLLSVSIGVLAYVFVGYPLLLRLLVVLRGPRRVTQADITPPVSLVISAWNEEAVIRRKIENALAIDYPAGAIEIVVVSDGSTDATDAIVGEYASRGVRLLRQEPRRGKTAGLNWALPQLRGEIVVFSDANAMYEPDAVRKLVRNFADPDVGCVTGEARYVPAGRSAADLGENAYWSYEIHLKRLESQVGSIVGGDGAIYAIRRSLWRPLPESAINDFLNPLQIVAAGYRNVYEPEAVCHEETAGGVGREYRRRVRIVSRSWRAVFQARGVLNPFRVGFFVVSVVSHKLLRWLCGVFLAGALVAAAALAAELPLARDPRVAGALVGLVAAALAFPRARRWMGVAWYFATVNAASLVGVWRGTFGQVSGTWSTPRHPAGGSRDAGLAWVRSVAAMALLAAFLGAIVLAGLFGRHRFTSIVFWAAVGLLLYVYLVYPAIMLLLRWLASRPTARRDETPTVCLFITAHNEASVIAEKLRNALALDYPRDRLQVVVSSDGSTDATNAIVRGFEAEGVRLLAFGQRRGKISAINRGVPQVEAEIVVFSDANTFLLPDALRVLVSRFADPCVGAVSGDVILVGDRAALAVPEDLYYRYERWLQGLESAVGSMVGADGALYAVRRSLFVPPADDTILDDMFIPLAVVRAGYRVVFEPAARAYEQGSRTAVEEFSRKSRVVAGAVQLVARSGRLVPWRDLQFVFSLVSHKVLRWLSPWLAIVAFTSSVGLATTQNMYVAMAAAQALFMLAGLAGCLPAFRRWRPIALAHYFWLVQAAAAVGLARGLAGRQPPAWRRFEHVPVSDAPAALKSAH